MWKLIDRIWEVISKIIGRIFLSILVLYLSVVAIVFIWGLWDMTIGDLTIWASPFLLMTLTSYLVSLKENDKFVKNIDNLLGKIFRTEDKIKGRIFGYKILHCNSSSKGNLYHSTIHCTELFSEFSEGISTATSVSTPEEARAAGYIPCPKCRPPVPREPNNRK